MDRMEKLIILGGGESGAGAAVLGKVKGFDVFLSDAGPIKPEYRDLLARHGVDFEEGGHSAQRILQADLVVKSPGIPSTAPLVEKLAGKGVPVISEIEFAGRYTDAKMVCITGSNGKTTTTLLTYHILKEAGNQRRPRRERRQEPRAPGGVGTPRHLRHRAFKLPARQRVRLQGRHRRHNEHNARPSRPLRPQDGELRGRQVPHPAEPDQGRLLHLLAGRPRGAPPIRQIQSEAVRRCRSARRSFPARRPTSMTASCASGRRRRSGEIPRDRLALTGLHNLYNSMAAGLSASLLNIRKEKIRRALEDFEAVGDRLEYVATVDGVRYVNDSKATNVNSTWYAPRKRDHAHRPHPRRKGQGQRLHGNRTARDGEGEGDSLRGSRQFQAPRLLRRESEGDARHAFAPRRSGGTPRNRLRRRHRRSSRLAAPASTSSRATKTADGSSRRKCADARAFQAPETNRPREDTEWQTNPWFRAAAGAWWYARPSTACLWRRPQAKARARQKPQPGRQVAARRPDTYIWGIYLSLLLISVIELFSASSTEVRASNVYAPLIRHCVFLGGGLLIVAHLPEDTLFRLPQAGVADGHPLARPPAPVIRGGVEINGAQRAIQMVRRPSSPRR